MTPHCLKVETKRNGVENCLENILLMDNFRAWLMTIRTLLEMKIGSSICNTRVNTYVILKQRHSSHLSKDLFDAIECWQ